MRVSKAAAAIWEQHRPTMRARLDALERAAADLGAGTLAPEVCDEAAEAAHKLAGTVGSFGFPLSSELARAAEKLLRAEVDASQAAELAEMVDTMRTDMDLTAFVATVTEAAPKPVALPSVLIVAPEGGAVEKLRVEAGRRGLRAGVARLVDAPALAMRDRPDALLLDFATDGPGALDLLGTLSREHPDMPVLVIADADSFSDRVAAAQRGAAGYVDAAATPKEMIDQTVLTLQRRVLVGTRVLMVTAEDAVAEGVREALGSEGIEVAVLADPYALWDELARVNPALVLLDADAPVAGGLELCRVLRNDSRWSVLPIILLVADADQATVAAVIEAGADDHVVKPAGGPDLAARVHRRLERFREHQALAETDMLTGLSNRRTATASLGHLIRLSERLEKPLCLAEIDVDHFKNVNDRYGHIAGDAALRRLGDMLRRAFRGEDIVARWGGEEFVVGLFGLERDGGIDRISALLSKFRSEVFAFDDTQVNLTFSAGVAQFPDDGLDLEALFGAADEALYAAKSGGRNQVVGAGSGHRTTQQVDVAIVEDEEATSQLIADGLTDRGHRCWRFSNGAGAIDMLAGERPRVRARVILLDLNLPAVGGMELLTLLARDNVLRSSRVIVVSANDDPAVVAHARELGAEEYRVKPVEVDELAALVEAALGRELQTPAPS